MVLDVLDEGDLLLMDDLNIGGGRSKSARPAYKVRACVCVYVCACVRVLCVCGMVRRAALPLACRRLLALPLASLLLPAPCCCSCRPPPHLPSHHPTTPTTAAAVPQKGGSQQG